MAFGSRDRVAGAIGNRGCVWEAGTGKLLRSAELPGTVVQLVWLAADRIGMISREAHWIEWRLESEKVVSGRLFDSLWVRVLGSSVDGQRFALGLGKTVHVFEWGAPPQKIASWDEPENVFCLGLCRDWVIVGTQSGAVAHRVPSKR
jgi:hypothetical protein